MPAFVKAEAQYLNAHISRLVGITQAFHSVQPTSLPVRVPDQMPSKDQRQRVWMIEEKLMDVQLALTVYRDALRGRVDQVVVCSNDSDVEPALKLIRQDAPNVRIGLVMPLRPDAKGQGVVSNKRLTAQATWVRHHILDAELAASQLPTHVTTKKKPASKPAHW
jgi:hypothetical protein